MKHTKIFAFVLAASLLVTALCACQSPSPAPADTPPPPPLSQIVETTPSETAPADTSSNTAPYTYDAQKQPYAQSLSSADDIKRVGIRMGDVIAEGQEQLLAFSATDENNNYKVIDSNYVRDEVTLLSTSPVIKYTPDYELIINLDNVYTYENGQPFTPYAFYSYDPELGSRGGYREVTEPLQAQGAYLMEIIVGVWSPRLVSSEPDRAPQLPPKQSNTVYPESYTYYFTVIVE